MLKKLNTLNFLILAHLSLASISLATTGTIEIQNQTQCKITPLLPSSASDDFTLSEDQSEDPYNTKLSISYEGINKERHYMLPISLDCTPFSYTQNLEITATNNRLDASTKEPFSFTPVQLVVSGPTYIDENSTTITIIARQVSIGD